MTCLKHKCKFVKNITRQSITHNRNGTRIRSSVVGAYKCVACDFTRLGTPNRNAEWPQLLAMPKEDKPLPPLPAKL